MKTRIHVVELECGTKLYYPQVRILLTWFNFKRSITPHYSVSEVFYILEAAQDFLKERHKQANASKIKSEKYLPYP